MQIPFMGYPGTATKFPGFSAAPTSLCLCRLRSRFPAVGPERKVLNRLSFKVIVAILIKRVGGERTLS